ncbi:MAG: site-specific integrase [Acidobacteriia bacterium]|nr:site-specific integrase [Terriglobia bacterium]
MHLTEKINQPDRLGKASFAQTARRYVENELPSLADTTQYCYGHIIDDYLVPRWGGCYAVEIKPNDVERWRNSLSKEAKGEDGLEWPTLRKMRNVMNLIYAHAQRQGLIPEDLKYNPVRPAGLGGARCKCTSDYEALILSPAQTFLILNLVAILERTLILLIAVTGLRISEAVGLQWRDIDDENSQINVRRRWIRGNVDKPKSKASKAPVAMARLLAEWLRAWKACTRNQKIGSLLLSRRMAGRRGWATCW